MKRRVGIAVVVTAALGGCGVEPSQSCQDYVACQRTYEQAFPRALKADTAVYEAEGNCWDNSNTAASCTAACTEAYDVLNTSINGFDCGT